MCLKNCIMKLVQRWSHLHDFSNAQSRSGSDFWMCRLSKRWHPSGWITTNIYHVIVPVNLNPYVNRTYMEDCVIDLSQICITDLKHSKKSLNYIWGFDSLNIHLVSEYFETSLMCTYMASCVQWLLVKFLILLLMHLLLLYFLSYLCFAMHIPSSVVEQLRWICS
jgi:hypothetical protein